MPFTKGTPKPAGSGRKKGFSLRSAARETMLQMGCDPIKGIIDIAQDKNAGKQLRLRAYAELAQYVYPKLRAMELSGPEGSAVEVHVSASEELLSRIASISARRG